MKISYVRISPIRTKYFYERDGRQYEFYIDHDPNTGLADMWGKPGHIEGLFPFLAAFGAEYVELNQRKEES